MSRWKTAIAQEDIALLEEKGFCLEYLEDDDIRLTNGTISIIIDEIDRLPCALGLSYKGRAIGLVNFAPQDLSQ